MSIKIHLDRDWSTGRVNLFIWQRHGSRLYAAQPIELIMNEVGEFMPGMDLRDKIRPFLQIHPDYHEELLSALAEALAKYGLGSPRTEGESGILEATKKHLEDMRRLVFEKEQGKG